MQGFFGKCVWSTTVVVVMALMGACGDETETVEQTEPESVLLGSPRWIVERFFAQDSFPEAGLYLDSTVKAMYDESGATFGMSLASDVKVKVRSLEADTLHSTVAVQISDTATAFDIYCYLNRGEDGWKLTTLRSLSGTGLLWRVVAELDTMAVVPDSMRFTLENCKLAISPDSALKAHLTNHMSGFDEVVAILNDNHVTQRVLHRSLSKATDETQVKVSELLEELYLASVQADSTGRVEVLVGGMGDNLVCYVYVPPGDSPPRIDRDHIIYVEPVVGRWYVFKTT